LKCDEQLWQRQIGPIFIGSRRASTVAAPMCGSASRSRESIGSEIPNDHQTETFGQSFSSQRELIELARTMDLEAIAKKTGRKRRAILETAKRLGIKITGQRR
jgi:ribosomal protein L32E